MLSNDPDVILNDCLPLIVGLAGTQLTKDEAAFLAHHRIYGIILFARNIVDGDQLIALLEAARVATSQPHLPILIDQEGGRVARLKPPLVHVFPPARAYGRLYETDAARGLSLLRAHAQLMAYELAQFGININCAPCVDVLDAHTHDVIGNRAFSEHPQVVAALGGAVMAGFEAGGVLPLIKHIPGHGRARSDSHHHCPEVDAPHDALAATDFVPFAALSHALLGMSAHIYYSALDDIVATQSRLIIETIIRQEIGFDGLLLSDDINMEALDGDVVARARAALAGGCDIILHCNGAFDEMRALADALPVLSASALRRARVVASELERLRPRPPAKARAVIESLDGFDDL